MSKDTKQNYSRIPEQRVVGAWLEIDPPASLDEAQEIGRFVAYAARREAEKAKDGKDNDFSYLFILQSDLQKIEQQFAGTPE